MIARTWKWVLAALVAMGLALPAYSQLATGAKAPDFKTMGMLGDKSFRLHLSEQLEEGPVVLYFFPRAFTSGCTLESKAFADAMPEFRAAGARVVGMSTDDLETLARFSTEVCASKVPMAHASGDLLKAYDVTLPMTGAVMPTADRVSYVIDTNGDIVMVHADMDYKDHVAKTLEAVQRLAR
ncbi:peroxiredoxin [Sphingomicrobium sediminis]|uniref:thioredoxin-dependent peroxiredoxin n=1 Tax=Sphingomicrobium sediminis TaxID=2950949 RepID=A0A9X2EI80_9SPHN|nr:peroxiredoxin [Sphingomicrobium sediminis]MCM8558005.1 peroxiredoxin [Sphingomicrobium sediminis]